MDFAPLDPAPPPAPINFRRFDDIDTHRNDIYRYAIDAFSAYKPLQNATHRIEIADPRYESEEFYPSKSDEKKAILSGSSIHRPLKAKLRLIDNNNNGILDEQEVTLARIPHLNSRGLFIRKGVIWSVKNQSRLRPGAYTRHQSNGGTETHFNVKPGTGRGFRVVLEPDTALFKIQIGQSTTRLYPVLKALGIDDEDIKEAWGEELFEKNFSKKAGQDSKDILKVVSKLGTGNVEVQPDLAPQALREILERAELDPETTELTLGKPVERLSPGVILDSTRKIIAVNRGDAKPDNRDSQAFQSLHGVEDFIKERLQRDQSGALRKILWKASREGKLGKIPSGLLDRNISSIFEGSPIAQAVEDVNPFEIYDNRQAITRMGEGGIGSEQSVSRAARGVQASYIGVIDSGRGPECYDALTEVMTRRGWVPWPDVRPDDEFACLIGGSVSYHHPSALHASKWHGCMYGASNTHIDYMVTPNHRMWSRCEGKLRSGGQCSYNIKLAADFEGHRLVHSSGFGPYVPDEPVTEFVLPPVEANGATKAAARLPPVGARLINRTDPINITDWLTLLGWYLAEGCTSIQVKGRRGSYTTLITQVESANPENVEEIKRLLERLPFTWHYYIGKNFIISGKQLALYLNQFGLAQDKFIPSYVYEAPVEAREAFVNALLKGDGKRWHGTDDRRTLHTTSGRLANDFQRLMFSLGKSTKHSVTVDNREERYHDVHAVYIHTRDERLITSKPRRRNVSDYYIVEDFNGMVYCATVPGGLLYVRRNGRLGFWCGNSSRLGLDLRVTDAALKGSDNKLYTQVKNIRTGDDEIVSARTLSSKVITFPGELASGNKRVLAIKDDSIEYVPVEEVDYELPDAGSMLSRASAMIPFPQSIKGQRLLMGSRMMAQSMPLKETEAPLVQTADSSGNSLYAKMGKYIGAAFSPVSGVVLSVTPDAIKVGTPDGEVKVIDLYNNYPTARKTVIHNTPIVKKGDVIDANQLVAKSNFTNDNGEAAIGRNLRTAWMVAEGATIEDAVVISESAAKKLTSEALYKSDLDLSEVESTKKGDYKSIYTDKFTQEQYDNIDDEGVVREGVEVHPGDPLILAIGKRNKRGVGALMDSPRAMHSDLSQVWEHNASGVVTDVHRGRGGIMVTVKSYSPTNAADKLTTRFGAKGVVSEIRPDDQMPLDENGQPVEVILNSLGVISRVNPGMLAEALLGKVAAKTGKKYSVQGFSHPSVVDFALEEAVKAGVAKVDENGNITDTETVTDPRDGRKIPGVFVGVTYMMKPHHMAESKLSARDVSGYTTEGIPARGGKDGSKRIGLLDTGVLISAGATEFLRDAKLIRGQRNDEYWRALKAGDTPMEPSVSFADEHFKSLLKAAGVNLRDKGTRTGLSPVLDRDVDELAQHEVENPDTFDFESMEPVKGGLFDIRITGGANGNRFSKIVLPKKIPHPMFVEPIQRMLGITGKKLEAVLSGKEELHGKTGPDAIEGALKNINVDVEIEQAKSAIRNSSKSNRDEAVKKLNYLVGLKKMDVAPADLMISRIPVIPPKYRPIVQAGGLDMVHDLNYLYHDLMEAKGNYKDAQDTFGDAGDEYMTMFNAVRAITGIREPVNPNSVEQGVKGVLRYAIGVGDTPKAAMFQRKVIGSAVDTVGRGVITADPKLDMDEVGIPEEMAWTIFKPFIIRRLARQGMPGTDALKEVKNRTPRAKKSLEDEMRERPVVYNRAPALHRYAYVGAWGKLRKDDAIGLPYHTLKNLGGDFDGDNVNLHVPVSPEAVKDAREKLMPSKSLFHTATFETHLEPMQDYVVGLYLASLPNKKEKTHTFATVADAKKAFARGQIGARTPIRILENK